MMPMPSSSSDVASGPSMGQIDPAREVLERMSDAFFALDTESRFTYINETAAQIIQQKREDLLGRNVWDIFPEALEMIFFQEFQHAIRDQVPVMFEAAYPPLHIWVAVRAYPSPTGITIFFQDITARKAAEAETQHLTDAARHRAEHIEAVFAAITDGVAIYDLDGNVVKCNEAFKQMLGASSESYLEMGTMEHRAAVFRVRDVQGKPIPFDELPTQRALRGETIGGANAYDMQLTVAKTVRISALVAL